jgi:hypothetical protein
MLTVTQVSAFSQVYDLRRLDGEATLLGKVELFGVTHHVLFVEVAVVDGHLQGPVNDPHNRYEDLQTLVGGGFLSAVSVPGWPGSYVASVFPYMD